MKTTLNALSLATLLFAACGDNTENATTTGDTTMAAPAATASTTTSTPDAMGGMKTAMDKMMADLKAMQSTGDPNHDFAAIMRAHHQGAVEMMQAYLPGANDAMLKGMAEQGISKQQGEINELSTFLSTHQPGTQKSDYGKDAVQMISDMMQMDAMPQSTDKAFAAMMIPHHESAVHISQMYLSQGKDAGLKAMAKKIADEQQREADEMKAWLNAGNK